MADSAVNNTSRTKQSGGYTKHQISRQNLIEMGFDPALQHLSQLKQLFRKKFKLDSGKYVTTTIGSTTDSTW